MKPNLRDAVPPQLFRYFQNKVHAEQFVAGVVRLGNLHGYATIEDEARRDTLEGRGEFAFPGVARSFAWSKAGSGLRALPPKRGLLHVSSFDWTPTFVCCLSKRKGVDLGERFGRFVVAVHNPNALVERITNAAAARSDLFGPLDCGSVGYDSAPRLQGVPTAEDLIVQASFTKPHRFRDEQEYRLVQWYQTLPNANESEETCPPAMALDLGGPLQDVTLTECTHDDR